MIVFVVILLVVSVLILLLYFFWDNELKKSAPEHAQPPPDQKKEIERLTAIVKERYEHVYFSEIKEDLSIFDCYVQIGVGIRVSIPLGETKDNIKIIGGFIWIQCIPSY